MVTRCNSKSPPFPQRNRDVYIQIKKTNHFGTDESTAEKVDTPEADADGDGDGAGQADGWQHAKGELKAKANRPK